MATNTYFKENDYVDIDLDFQIMQTLDPRVLSIYDISAWGHIQEKASIVEVLTPASKNPIVLPYTKCAINTFNSVNLHLNCEGCKPELNDLPDGLYEITIKGSPSYFNKTRYYLRTVKANLELDKLFINLDLIHKKPTKEFIDKLIDIQLLLRASEANVRFENIEEAQQLFLKAQELIKKFQGCTKCF